MDGVLVKKVPLGRKFTRHLGKGVEAGPCDLSVLMNCAFHETFSIKNINNIFYNCVRINTNVVQAGFIIT